MVEVEWKARAAGDSSEAGAGAGGRGIVGPSYSAAMKGIMVGMPYLKRVVVVCVCVWVN